MDVSSLYTNIPEEEGTEVVCKACEMLQLYSPPIPKHYLRYVLGVILTENSFEFSRKKKLSPDPWCRNGHKDSSVFCKYIHGGD